MSFNLGQTTGFPSVASTATTFAGFGSSTTTAAKGFGQPTLGFGAAPSSTGGFGTTATPGAFGSTPQTGAFGVAPTTSTFGAPQTGGFGNTQGGGMFGGQQSTFGVPAANTFGQTAFGSAPATSSFGFSNNLGTATSTAGSLFGGVPSSGTMFGQPQAASAPFQSFGSFGATQPNTGGGLFGGTNTGLQTSTASSGFNFSGLGTKPTLGQSAFPSNFGTGGLGSASMFGQNQQQTGMFGQQQQQQQQQQTQQQSQDELVYTAVLAVNLFGDERDAVLARCNLLQAQWGTGKGFYAQGAPPVTFTQDNPFFRFKALGYSQLPAGKEEDGVVSIYFNKKESEIKAQQQQLIASISSALFKGSSQYTMVAQGVRASTENGCQMLVTVSERTTSGQTRKIAASELTAHLINMRTQLMSAGIENIVPVVRPSAEWVRDYLATPPAGIDPRLWQQAQLDSPDPDRFIPVPMVGFAELRWRMKCQESESSRHMAYLAQAEQQVSELRRAVTETEVKINERRQSLLALQRRLLRLLVKLQVARRAGTAMLPLEEEFRTRLEQIQAQLSRPSHCKARLGELLSQMRLQSLTTGKLGGSSSQNYTFDTDSVLELHKFLTMEQEGISHLIDVATTDRDSIKVISQGMSQIKRTIEANQSFILTNHASL